MADEHQVRPKIDGKQVQDAVKTFSKYATQAKSGGAEIAYPKGTKRSHLHPSFQTADKMKALRRDMYNSRQTQQWDTESTWWVTQEGKEWLASQDIKCAKDFWYHFGVAHKFWTFERMYECKEPKDPQGSNPKDDRATTGQSSKNQK